MEKSIVHKWSLPHPPEQVWEYLTRADLLGKWLMENDFKPVTGHKFPSPQSLNSILDLMVSFIAR